MQQHLDQLTAMDAGFLDQEGPATHMQIGGVARFSGPPPRYGEIVAHIRSRLHLVPRYRQKVVMSPGGLGRPRWVDDPTFNLEYHVRHTGLPAPGDDDRLHRLVGRVFAQPLDRAKPLWELWVVEGLQDGGWALLSKTHHALVDGVAGVDLLTMLFDYAPEGRETLPDRWQPGPEPTRAQLAATALSETADRLLRLPFRALASVGDPQPVVAAAGRVVGAARELLGGALDPAPPSPLNVRIGPHRRVTHVACRLDDFRDVKDAFGGTVNDVVIAVVAGAVRTWMHGRGLRTEGLELRACVPVSVREPQDGAFGNRITEVLTPLPVAEPDPVARLRTISAALDGVRDAALGAQAIAGAREFAPPTILAQASRQTASGRHYNLLVTNIPGPQVPLYVLGQELLSMFPVAFLAGDHALGVGVMSYNGSIDFGLIGDFEALSDLDAVADGVRASLAELKRAAAGTSPSRPGGRRRPQRRSTSGPR